MHLHRSLRTSIGSASVAASDHRTPCCGQLLSTQDGRPGGFWLQHLDGARPRPDPWVPVVVLGAAFDAPGGRHVESMWPDVENVEKLQV